MKKISINPAILENNLIELERQLVNYDALSTQIDIDINIFEDKFKGKVTLDLDKTLECIKVNKIKSLIGLDLMVNEPLQEILKIEKYYPYSKFKFYLHQSTDYLDVLNRNLDIYIGIAISEDDEVKSIEFYKNFPEIQLMTVKPGWQGGEFLEEMLNRVEWLRSNGYKGIISLDGAVNLKSAELIKNYDINRVSVGSYFSKAENIRENYDKLYNVLNFK